MYNSLIEVTNKIIKFENRLSLVQLDTIKQLYAKMYTDVKESNKNLNKVNNSLNKLRKLLYLNSIEFKVSENLNMEVEIEYLLSLIAESLKKIILANNELKELHKLLTVDGYLNFKINPDMIKPKVTKGQLVRGAKDEVEFGSLISLYTFFLLDCELKDLIEIARTGYLISTKFDSIFGSEPTSYIQLDLLDLDMRPEYLVYIEVREDLKFVGSNLVYIDPTGFLKSIRFKEFYLADVSFKYREHLDYKFNVQVLDEYPEGRLTKLTNSFYYPISREYMVVELLAKRLDLKVNERLLSFEKGIDMRVQVVQELNYIISLGINKSERVNWKLLMWLDSNREKNNLEIFTSNLYLERIDTVISDSIFKVIEDLALRILANQKDKVNVNLNTIYNLEEECDENLWCNYGLDNLKELKMNYNENLENLVYLSIFKHYIKYKYNNYFTREEMYKCTLLINYFWLSMFNLYKLEKNRADLGYFKVVDVSGELAFCELYDIKKAKTINLEMKLTSEFGAFMNHINIFRPEECDEEQSFRIYEYSITSNYKNIKTSMDNININPNHDTFGLVLEDSGFILFVNARTGKLEDNNLIFPLSADLDLDIPNKLITVKTMNKVYIGSLDKLKIHEFICMRLFKETPKRMEETSNF